MIDFDRRVRRQQAVHAFERGDDLRAFELGRGLLEDERRDPALLEMVGLVAVRIGRPSEAERLLRKALRAAPRRIDLLVAMAEALVQQGRLDDGLERYERVLRMVPGLAVALTGKASILQRRGENDAARELVEPLIATGLENAAAAEVFAAIQQSEGRHRESIDFLRRHLERVNEPPVPRAALWKLLGKAHQKSGEHDEAFAAFAMSNGLLQRPFDADAYVREIDDIIATFSPANLAALPRGSSPSEVPVFIASLPRSGSTLIEQIIHAHPRAHGAGEITDLDDLVTGLPTKLESVQPYPACLGDWTRRRADEIGGAMLASLRRHDRRADRVVNKHLDNWRHVGLVALLFPGARVIHCRRHPLDNGLSIFMAGMNAGRYPWATDLDRLGLVYRQQERLMNHWRRVLDIEILDVEYEAVVADPEPQIRRIVDFCGLPWDERCLRFHEAERDVMTLSYDQVRRPMYRSASGRYEKYRAHLGPLEAALVALGGQT